MTDDIDGTLALSRLPGDPWPQAELPSWYYDYEGNVVIRTPYATSVIYNKSVGRFPWTDNFPGRHYHDPENLYTGVRNTQLDPDRISFKKFGEDAEIYEVVRE